MHKGFVRSALLPLLLASIAVPEAAKGQKPDPATADTFMWQADQFADVRILRYKINGWDQLSLQQKQLAYYLTQAGLCGRDIMWDQNHRYNLRIRRALEAMIKNYKGDRTGKDWDGFVLYAKEVFFSNGIHHHYGMDKFVPAFDRKWFEKALASSGGSLAPEVLDVMFDPKADAKKVSLDPSQDLLLSSAVNFYAADVTEKEASEFYAALEKKAGASPDAGSPTSISSEAADPSTSKANDANAAKVDEGGAVSISTVDAVAANEVTRGALSHGINSQLAHGPDGALLERTWMVGGMYGEALKNVISWLEKAQTVAENKQQSMVIGLLIDYYRTGDLNTWDQFNIEWVKETEGTVDFIQGFVEVYNDPLGKRGSYESIVQVIDPIATKNMRAIQDNAQWFEDNSPILPEHKKKEVVGITYRFINVVGESGDAAPATPVGVNLPNANWIRALYGSKSVSLGNISEAYEKSGGKGLLEVFCNDKEEVDRAVKYGSLAGTLHTALHEVIGHASGLIEPGVGETDATLRNYASTIEEGRADLVALYYMMDPKMVELGVMPSLEVGMAEYDGYIRNGLMVQLRRIKPGGQVEEAHMRNRQWISAWCLEKGKGEVIKKVVRDGATYYDIVDYNRLRGLFGDLLREVQRIKSKGDYEAAKALVENYGVKVDPKLHEEVLTRAKKVKTAPYAGFIQPQLIPKASADGEILDVTVQYPTDFIQQMLMYGEKYSFLPDEN